MRLLPLALLSAGLLAGCAGNLADYVGPRPSIVAPQLTRYGFNAEATQCVAARLAASLTPLQLRQLVRYAEVVREGYFDPAQLTPRDLMHVASTIEDPQIRLELARATEGCQVGIVTIEVPAPAITPGDAGSSPPPPPAWLNLGAAPTGQSIAVDAATLAQEEAIRRAWVRLTNPDATEPTDVSYLLRIDCTARTLEALAHRRQDAAGAVTEYHEYARDAEGPLPIEGGTVMEIAFLALCT
jgi:hypothetical protein